MEGVPLEALKDKVDSIFKLSNMAARRAMELNSGMKSLVEADPTEKFTTIALREIANGKVKLKEADEKT